ncbi:hypothetical protein Vi05172_g5776 [Venturia inaequalis]|nr:hypothetical protein Vi05172_g5776 [Venturia inaequalis]
MQIEPSNSRPAEYAGCNASIQEDGTAAQPM